MTLTPVTGTGAFTYIVDVTWLAADATSGNIVHGLGVTPKEVHITPLAFGATPSQFSATTVDATNVVITKFSTAANTTATTRVIIKRPFQQQA
jgi:hypothetical protein